MERCVLFLFSKKKQYAKGKLLVLKTDAIGDAIIWLDSAKEYRKYFPNDEITLLCNKSWSELAEKLPYFDKVIAIDKNKFSKNLKYRFSFLYSVRKVCYEKIINPVYSRDYFVADALVRNCCAKEKIGAVGNYENTDNALRRFLPDFHKMSSRLKKKADNFYTTLIDTTPLPLMELSRNAEFIRNYLDRDFQSQLPEVPFQLQPFGELQDRRYVVFFLGAGTLRRVWPVENYLAVVNAISPDVDIVLCGGKEDSPLYALFEKHVMAHVSGRKFINLIGKTNLFGLMSVIKEADYIISNETSAVHIAAMVHTPSVCLLSGAHFERFVPYVVESITEEEKQILPLVANYYMDCYYCNHRCKYINDKVTTYPCVVNIKPEIVVDKIHMIAQKKECR